MKAVRPAIVILMFAAVAATTGCETSGGAQAQAPAAGFPNIGYANWTDAEPPYRIFPGDEIEIAVPSAPELSKSVVVPPDGRISMNLIAPVMAADRTVEELQGSLANAYSSQLRRPAVSVSVKTATPLRVFVGGEVDKAGVYDMPGDINALQAIIQAGGFAVTAKRQDVVIIRRGPDGRAMMRTVDLLKATRNPAGTDLVPLRRFDIVYVPRSGIAEANLAVQQYFRDLIPVNFGFSYAINGLSN